MHAIGTRPPWLACVVLIVPVLLAASRPAAPPEVFRKSTLHSSNLKQKPVFVPLAPGAVEPQEWLRDWAVEAANGITGHLDEYSKTFGEAWKGYGFDARGANPDGTGWPLEQSSYWLDGAVRLAWILHDPALMAKTSKRLDMVVTGVLKGGQSFIYWRPQSVVTDTFNSWAHSHMGRALVAYYQATGNPRVLQALIKIYRDFPLPDPISTFDNVNGSVNIDPMIDTYLMSGDEAVLRRAIDYSKRAAYRDVAGRWLRSDLTPGHNVIFYEDIRVPALLYPWTGDRNDLAATERAVDWSDKNYLLPMGLSSGEEYHAGIGATRNVETCNVAASMWTFLGLLRITGKASYSDRIERVFFNAGPAPVARDFKTMSYYQSPNRYSASNPKEEPQNPGAESYKFTPIGHPVLCCVGNLNRVIPNYVMHMWMSTLDDGLAATLYGPSKVRAAVANHTEVDIDEKTAYPFDESILLSVSPEKPVSFPLYLRIPGWCPGAEIRVNGQVVPVDKSENGFVRIAREWHPGDHVAIRLPMAVRIVKGRETPYPQISYFAKSRSIARENDISSPWASIYYGPLLFAVPIRDMNPNQEASGAHFQYALDVTPSGASRDIKLVRRPMPAHWNWPLDAPLQLTAPVTEFDWRPAELLPLPKAPIKGGKPARVALVPYGCTKFRVSMLPVTDGAWNGR